MPELVPWFLFLHVLSAIIAFGPTFAFPVIGAMGGKEPQHSNFATRVSHRIGDKIVEPVALTMPVTGIGLIWSAGIDVFARSGRWLDLAIVLYVVAISLALFVSRPAVVKIIEMTGGHLPAGQAAAAPGLASPGPGAAGAPPAGLMEAVGRVQTIGKILTVLLVVIVFLMVVKPDFGF